MLTRHLPGVAEVVRGHDTWPPKQQQPRCDPCPPADMAGRMLTFVWVALLGNFLVYGGGKQVVERGVVE